MKNVHSYAALQLFFSSAWCILVAVTASFGAVKTVSSLPAVSAPLSLGTELSHVGLTQWSQSVELAAVLRQDPSLTPSPMGSRAPSVEVSPSASSCPSTPSIPDASAIAWVGSPAYATTCHRAYDAAWQKVEAAAQSQAADWVVVLDVDDTVLQTWDYGRKLLSEGRAHTPRAWERWVLSQGPSEVPGAKEFLRKVRSLGPRAHIAFITDDSVELESAKSGIMTRLGLLEKDDIFLSKTGLNDTKEERRRCLEDGASSRCGRRPLRIIASIGDSIRDHVHVADGAAARELRRRILSGHLWCPDRTACIMLPNPVYGDWEFGYRQ